jgi:peptidoglycan/xylan/chitin deacetylase (PgdA/CDA1 family)
MLASLSGNQEEVSKAVVPRGLRQRLIAAMVRSPFPLSDHRRRVLVLLYHSIHPSKGFASATPDLFEEHMSWVREHCNVISIDDALTRAARPRNDKPTVAVTFDDGYADVHEYGFPVLERFEIPATIFVMVGLTDRDPAVVARIAELQGASAEEVTGLSWDQMLEMRDAGMTFGSHGLHHTNLALADDQTVGHEARASKDRLEEKLGTDVHAFAYPFGKPKHHFTKRTMQLVASCGYRIGATVNFRRVRSTDDPMAIPRFAVEMDSVEMLEAKVKGKLDLIGMYQQYAPAWAGRIISPETSIKA